MTDEPLPPVPAAPGPPTPEQPHKPRLSLTRTQLEDPVALDLLQLLHSIVADGRVSEAEIGALSEWLRQHAGSQLPAVAYLAEVTRGVLADGKITPEERTWIQRAIETVLPAEVRQEAIARRREAAAEVRAQKAAAREDAQKAKVAEREQARLARPIRQFDVMVAGAYYGNRQAAIRLLREGTRITLAREPDSPYSKNAVVLLTPEGRRIGYLPEFEASSCAPLIDAGSRHEAEVKKILVGKQGFIPVVWGYLFAAESSEGQPSPRVPFEETPPGPGAATPATPGRPPVASAPPRGPSFGLTCGWILVGLIALALVLLIASRA